MSTDTSATKPPAFIKQAGSGAIKTVEDLVAAVKGFSSAKNKPLLKAQLIRAAKRLKATHRLPKGWTGAKTESALEERAMFAPGRALAPIGHIDCPEGDCARWFLNEDQLFVHGDRAHAELDLEILERPADDYAADGMTFNDIEERVREAVREKYWQPGDYRASPPIEGVYAWVRDLAVDWVVYTVEKGGDDTLYKASYNILDGNVTLGEPVEVVRKTVYEPLNKED